MARRAETVIYLIANARYGFTNPGDKVLSEFAQRTGGAAFFPLREVRNVLRRMRNIQARKSVPIENESKPRNAFANVSCTRSSASV